MKTSESSIWWEEIKITPQMKSLAREIANKNYFKVEFESRDVRYTGALGVLSFRQFCINHGIHGKVVDKYEYDFVIKCITGEVKLEFKAMTWYSIPRPDHVFLNSRCRFQECDLYGFGTIDVIKHDVARILGYLPTDVYKKIYRFSPKKSREYMIPETECDNYVINFNQIRPVKELLNRLKFMGW
jgi:hypothetical protein